MKICNKISQAGAPGGRGHTLFTFLLLLRIRLLFPVSAYIFVCFLLFLWYPGNKIPGYVECARQCWKQYRMGRMSVLQILQSTVYSLQSTNF